MPKSKYAPALFEVIRGQQEAKPPSKLALPKWWRSGRNDAREVDREESPAMMPADTSEMEETPVSEGAATFSLRRGTAVLKPEVPEPPVVRGLVPLDHDSQAGHPPTNVHTASERWGGGDADDFTPRRILKVDAGRIALSLNARQAALIGGVLVLAIFVSFEVGHLFGRSSSAPATVAKASGDEVEQALRQPPNPSVLKPQPPAKLPRPSGLKEPARSPEAAAKNSAQKASVVQPTPAAQQKPMAPVEVQPAKPAGPLTYVVLETFDASHKGSAEFAQQWLQKKNVATTLEKKGNRWRLVSAQGFDFSSPDGSQKTQQYVEEVKSFGTTINKDLIRAGLPNYVFSSPAKERMER